MFIKDIDCTKDTPVVLGKPDNPVYGKPDAEIREAVKHNGFKWSPKNKCWQRQLTNNAKYSLKCLIKQLDQLAG